MEIILNRRHKNLLKNLTSGSVLNLGSAEGDLHKAISNTEKIGIDIINNSNVDIVHDLNMYPYPLKRKFDNIIAGGVIEHLDNPTNFLNECYRLLKDDGRLILDTPNISRFHFINHKEHILGWNIPLLRNLINNRTKFKIEKMYLFSGYGRNLLFRLIKTTISCVLIK